MMAAIVVEMELGGHHARLEIKQHLEEAVYRALAEYRRMRVVMDDHRHHESREQESRGNERRHPGAVAQEVGGKLGGADGERESKRDPVDLPLEAERICQNHWRSPRSN